VRIISEIIARGHLEDALLHDGLQLLFSCGAMPLVHFDQRWCMDVVLTRCRLAANPTTTLEVFRALRAVDQPVLDEAEYVYW
jgi:hypothetical protein